MLKNYREWSKLFPKNETIKYLATDGKEGALPDYMSKGFLKSGFLYSAIPGEWMLHKW